MQLDQQAYEAATKGYTTQVCRLIEQGATDVDYMAIGAAEGGYRQLLYALTGDSYQLLASSFPTILAEAMAGASLEQLYECRHSDIKEELATYPTDIPLKLVVSLATKERSDSGAIATKERSDSGAIATKERSDSGAIATKERSDSGAIATKSLGYAKDYDAIACAAARHGYTDIVVKYLPKISDINYVAYCAARGGYTSLVDKLIAQGANDIDYIASAATKARYLELADKLAKLPRVPRSSMASPKKDKEPVTTGMLAGLDQLPQGILRQYLVPYLTQREKGVVSAVLQDVEDGHRANMKDWPLIRLVKYVDDYPDDQVALELLSTEIEKDPDAVYQAMIQYDHPMIIDAYPDKVVSLFCEALKEKKGKIVTALVHKYGLKRFEQFIN